MKWWKYWEDRWKVKEGMFLEKKVKLFLFYLGLEKENKRWNKLCEYESMMIESLVI